MMNEGKSGQENRTENSNESPESRRCFLKQVTMVGGAVLAAQPFVGCNSGSGDGTKDKDSAANASAPNQGKHEIAKVIAVEEQFVTPSLRDAWAALPPHLQDIGSKGFEKFDIKSRLENFADLRVSEMDAVGIDVQVLSPATPGVQNLEVPVFIHPQMPPAAIRDIYYSGFGGEISDSFATSGWGWHLETGIQAVWLILSGLFDRFPDLQIILGHWGQSMLFYLERIDGLSRFTKNLKQPVADYVRQNFHITPSGIFNQQYLKWTLEVMGPERVMFATDYPYKLLPDDGARDFIRQSGLDAKTQNLIAAGNWERLTGKIKRS